MCFQRSFLLCSGIAAGFLAMVGFAAKAAGQTAPVAVLDGPTELSVGQSASWSFGASDTDGDLLKWRFYRDDNATPRWTNGIPGDQVNGVYPQQGTTFSFDKPGFYTWIVEVEDATGLRSWTHLTIRVSLRINAGRSTNYTAAGVLWLADRDYNGGSTATSTTTVSNTSTPELFKTERYEPSTSAPLGYDLAVNSATTYLVRLLFAETHAASQTVGGRIFHVDIEGARAFSNIDIFDMAGGKNRAMVLERSLTTADSSLTIGFVRQVQNPKINAIEVIPLTRQPLRINTGQIADESYQDSVGNIWSTDRLYSTGQTSTISSSTAITGTSDPALYRTERYDRDTPPELRYSFPVPMGSYRVRLHFAETFSTTSGNGLRVFDIDVEGRRAFEDVDIYRQAGGARKALVLETTAQVSDGAVDIAFSRQVQNPKINAIEVLAIPPDAVDPQPPTQPGPLTFSNITSTGVTVNWPASTDNVGVISYGVSRGGTPRGSVTGLTFADSGLSASTSYSYSVVALDAAGNSSTPRTGSVTTASGSTPLSTVRVNCGSSSYTDADGNVWAADSGYNTGATYSTSSTIAGTTSQSLFRTERYDAEAAPDLVYAFNVTSGSYTLRLLFAENHSSGNGIGLRVFDVDVQDVRTFEDIDIFAEAGGYNRALIKTVPVTITDGQLRIRFGRQVQNPKINAIELVPATTSSLPAAPTATVATSVTSGGFRANWSSVSGATSYRLDVSTSSSFGTFVTGYQDRDVGNVASFAVTGLTPSTNYYYRVRAVNASGTSGNSNTFSVTTSAANPNADDDGDGILNGVEQQLGTTGHATTPDSGNSTQLKVHKP